MIIFSFYDTQGEVLLWYIESEEERRKILFACHVDPTSGHMGKSRTIYRIKERFMWHGMVKDGADLVSGRLEEYVHTYLYI